MVDLKAPQIFSRFHRLILLRPRSGLESLARAIVVIAALAFTLRCTFDSLLWLRGAHRTGSEPISAKSKTASATSEQFLIERPETRAQWDSSMVRYSDFVHTSTQSLRSISSGGDTNPAASNEFADNISIAASVAEGFARSMTYSPIPIQRRLSSKPGVRVFGVRATGGGAVSPTSRPIRSPRSSTILHPSGIQRSGGSPILTATNQSTVSKNTVRSDKSVSIQSIEDTTPVAVDSDLNESQTPSSVGNFEFTQAADGSSDVVRLGPGGNDHIGTVVESGAESIVLFDGEGAADHWSEFLGELYIISAAPELAGTTSKSGFQLGNITDSSLMIASGFQTGDILIAVDAMPIENVTIDSLAETLFESQTIVSLMRANSPLTITVVSESHDVLTSH